MEYVLSQLKNLTSIDSPTGFTKKAAEYVANELKAMGYEPKITLKGGVLCCIGGEGHPVILSAHLDTLGAMVAEIKGNGRLRVLPLGGLQPNNAETENCTIYTRFGNKKYSGTMQMNDPSVHVNREYGEQKRKFDSMEIVIDEKTSSKDETAALGIEVGDIVCFDPRTVITESGFIKSRFLDDKLSVAMLLDVARLAKLGGLNRKVYLYITVYEEVGHGCSASIPADAEDIISVDMGCVGGGLGCDEHKVSICAKDSHGPYNYDLTAELIGVAKAKNLDYAIDIYPYYGSDADAALDAGNELRHGLIGAGVYASHGYERSHIDGVRNTVELIKGYIME